MLSLKVNKLCKKFHGHNEQIVSALDQVSFTINPGEIFTLLGPSGCGKTTTLRSIAGLERPDTGVIEIGDRKVFDSSSKIFIPPNEREIGMVFQSYAIWPHMNVFDNVAFPLKQYRPKISKKEIESRVERALETVQLGDYQKRSATQLSGGQQQRLALARAIVSEPKLLLLDEPLSNLDAKLRELMRFELKRLQRELGITTVYVTHDQAEALALSSQIAVMKNGHIVQLGTPNEIYQRPANQFVADFIGSTNLIKGKVQQSASIGAIQLVETEQGMLQCTSYEEIPTGNEVLISLRPENIVLREHNDFEGNIFEGVISNRVFLGDFIDYLVQLSNKKELRVRAHPDQDFLLGQKVYLTIPFNKCVTIPLS